MHLEILAEPAVAAIVSQDVALDGRFTVGVGPAPDEAPVCDLLVGPDTPAEPLADLVAALRRAWNITVRRVSTLAPGRVELRLAGEGRLSRWNVRLFGPRDFTGEVEAELRRAGFTRVSAAAEPSEREHQVAYGGAGDYALGAVAACLRRLGVRHIPRVKLWGGEDNDIFVKVSAPRVLNHTTRDGQRVTLVTDAMDSVAPVVEGLKRLGFGEVQIQASDFTPGEARLGVDPGPLERGGDEPAIGGLLALVDQAAAGACIDPHAFPVTRLPASSADAAVLHLPLKRVRRGLIRPWGDVPGRYQVRVCCDDRAFGLKLAALYRQAGFHCVYKRFNHELSLGWAIRSATVAASPAITEICREVLEKEMIRADVLGGGITFIAEGDNVIEILAPVAAHSDGRLERELCIPGRFKVIVRGADEKHLGDVGAVIGELGFSELELDVDNRIPREQQGFVDFGGCPEGLVDRIREQLAERFGDELLLRARKSWSMADMRIVISLPRTSVRLRRRPRWGAMSGVAGVIDRDAPRFIEETREGLRVGQVMLERASPDPRLPAAPFATPVCIDPLFASLTEFLAQCVALRAPALLVGATGVSKSMSVSFLAHRLGRPLIRQNLSGHSSVAELVGQYVPNDQADAAGAAWRWHDGSLPRAMRGDGAWLLLDEVNVAEAHVVERINSALERPATLVVSEHLGEAIEPGECFWVAATANPGAGSCQYAGRSAMSPAFRDRFLTYWAADPGEAEYLAYVSQCVTGRGPGIEVQGRAYRGETVAPAFPGLAGWADAVLIPLARFHASLAAATRDGERLGEGEAAPTVTRRKLDLFLRFLARDAGACRSGADRMAAAGRALETVYLAGAGSEAAQDVIRDLAHAAGLAHAPARATSK